MNIAFDVTYSAVVRVNLPDGMDRAAAIQLAQAAIKAETDCLDVGRTIVADANGQPVVLTMTEASPCDEDIGEPFEIDGEDPAA